MKRTKHDFEALTAKIFKDCVHDVGTEPLVSYCTMYPLAIADAIERREYVPLLKLLNAQEPIHPCLGPALADAFMERQSKRPGHSPAVSSAFKSILQTSMLQMKFHRQKVGKMQDKISTETGISADTLRGYWREIPDKPRGRCKLSDCRICNQFEEMPSNCQ